MPLPLPDAAKSLMKYGRPLASVESVGVAIGCKKPPGAITSMCTSSTSLSLRLWWGTPAGMNTDPKRLTGRSSVPGSTVVVPSSTA